MRLPDPAAGPGPQCGRVRPGALKASSSFLLGDTAGALGTDPPGPQEAGGARLPEAQGVTMYPGERLPFTPQLFLEQQELRSALAGLSVPSQTTFASSACCPDAVDFGGESTVCSPDHPSRRGLGVPGAPAPPGAFLQVPDKRLPGQGKGLVFLPGFSKPSLAGWILRNYSY